MLEFVWNNMNTVLLTFLGVEFAVWTLSFILPKIENVLSTIGYVVLALGDSFLFTVAILTNRWDYLLVSIALMIVVVLLIKVSTSITVLEDFSKAYEENK